MSIFLYNDLQLYIILIPIITILLILINNLISPSNNYIDKLGPFECGFSSFRQSRITYSVSFILIALLFLPFDIEITTILPYTVSIYNTNSYGLFMFIYFNISLLIGFIFEINMGALYIKHIFKRSDKSLYNKLYN